MLPDYMDAYGMEFEGEFPRTPSLPLEGKVAEQSEVG